jgi:signal transduction histidine kinase
MSVDEQRAVAQESEGSTAWVGVVAGLVACAGALTQGLAQGWTISFALGYVALALCFLALVLGYQFAAVQRWLGGLTPFVLLAGGLCFGLQVLSGDPFLQPIMFGVPLVYAARCLSLARTLAVASLYLGLMTQGLLLSGPPGVQAIMLPLVGYGTMMLTLIAFTRLSVAQAQARRQADALAGDLARERDELAWLLAENTRLQDEIRLLATLSERNRLARELHDTIAQGLTAVTMQLDAAQRSFERDPGRSRARLARAYELARGTLADVRASVWTLAEPLVDGGQLDTALAAEVRRFQEQSGIPTRYDHAGPRPALSHTASTQTLRIVREALRNVEKHADASSVVVGSELNEHGLRVWVADDGRGFDPQAREPGSGFGLFSLHERAKLAGGSLDVASAPGAGTTVTLKLPAERPALLEETR